MITLNRTCRRERVQVAAAYVHRLIAVSLLSYIVVPYTFHYITIIILYTCQSCPSIIFIIFFVHDLAHCSRCRVSLA